MASQMCNSYQMQFRLWPDCQLLQFCPIVYPGRWWHNAGQYFVWELLFVTCCCYFAVCAGSHLSGRYWYNKHSNKSGNQQLSDTIMTPHLQVEHLSLNPHSLQLTICLTQLYIVCSFESAVFISTSFCCFTSVCVILSTELLPVWTAAGSTKQWVICHSYCYCWLHMRIVLHWDARLLSRWLTYQVICRIFSRWGSQHWTWIRWTIGSSWSKPALMMTRKVWT